MTLKQAEYIVAIYQEGNFALAAQKLYISQPALSQIIKCIEMEVGAPIFIRRTFPIQLSDAGAKCLDVARGILALNQNLKREIAIMKNGNYEKFRFGLYQTQSKDLLKELLKAYPMDIYNISVSMTGSHQLEQMLLNGLLDIALVNTLPTYLNLEYIPVKEDILGVIIRRDSEFAKLHRNCKEIDFYEAKNERFVLRMPGNNTRNQFDLLCQKYHISPNIVLECDLLNDRSILENIQNSMTILPKGTYEKKPWLQEIFQFFFVRSETLLHNSYITYYKGTTLVSEMKKWCDIVINYFCE